MTTTSWTGTNGFRLYPHEDFASGDSTATLTPVAGGIALALDYTWVHPEQGEQSGHLVIGRPDDSGTVTAAWTDTFHQSPEIRTLQGAAAAGLAEDAHPIDGEGVALDMEYMGWGWTIAVRREEGLLAMMMQNVIPEGVEGAEPGAYDVMRAAWEPVCP
jgi:hypothetical protein